MCLQNIKERIISIKIRLLERSFGFFYEQLLLWETTNHSPKITIQNIFRQHSEKKWIRIKRTVSQAVPWRNQGHEEIITIKIFALKIRFYPFSNSHKEKSVTRNQDQVTWRLDQERVWKQDYWKKSQLSLHGILS